MIKITLNKGNKVSYKIHFNDGSSKNVNPKELEQLYNKIGKILGKVDWKKEMEKDKKKFL